LISEAKGVERDYKPVGYWTDLNNCRQFFETFAHNHGFDPQDPEKWKTIPTATIKAVKVITNKPFGLSDISFLGCKDHQ